MPRKSAANAPNGTVERITVHAGRHGSVELTRIPVASQSGNGIAYRFHCTGRSSEEAAHWLRRELNRQDFPLGFSLTYEGDGSHSVQVEQPAPHLAASLGKGRGVITNEAEFRRLSDPKAMRDYAVSLCDRVSVEMEQYPQHTPLASHRKPNVTIDLDQVSLDTVSGHAATGYLFRCSGACAAETVEWMRDDLRRRHFPLGSIVSYARGGNVSLYIETPAEWMKARLVALHGEVPGGMEFDRLASGDAMKEYALGLAERAATEMQNMTKSPRPVAAPRPRNIVSVRNNMLEIVAHLEPVTYSTQQAGQKCCVRFKGKFAEEASEKFVNELKIRKYPAGTARGFPSEGAEPVYTVEFPQPQPWMMTGLERNAGIKAKDLRKYAGEEKFIDLVKQSVAAVYSDYVPIGEEFEITPRPRPRAAKIAAGRDARLNTGPGVA